MHFRDEENAKLDWNVVASDFILHNDKKRIRKFIQIVHQTKLEVERKMRYELDMKILLMRSDRLYDNLGRLFIAKLRCYIKKYHSEGNIQFQM